MRLYIHCDKKRFWHTLLLFYIVTALLVPTVHSHDLRHDDGKIYHNLAQEVTDAHNHTDHHAASSPSDTLFTHSINFTDLSRHDHNSNLHAHAQNLLYRISNIQCLDSPSTHEVKCCSVSEVTSRKTFNKLSPVPPPSSLLFVSITTNLPPPIV